MFGLVKAIENEWKMQIMQEKIVGGKDKAERQSSQLEWIINKIDYNNIEVKKITASRSPRYTNGKKTKM